MTAPRVLIADQLSPAAVDIFKQRGVETDVKVGLSKEELEKIIKDYDGLAVRSATKATEKIIAAATNLKVIGRAGIGVDNVDIPAATAKGIVVMNTPFGNSITTAEHAIALMFAAARQVPAADVSTQAGKWEKNRFMGVELYAKTLGLIGWFMALTRFEPSVLRAGVMAMLASSSFLLGRPQSVVRLLAWAIAILVLVDPMLVWSVGFWLSTGATAGVCVVAPPLAERLSGPAWFRVPLAVTLGAQLGVLLPSWLVFHRLPLVSVPANLLAVPVAGLVMLIGIPGGLASAIVPPLAILAERAPR